MSDKKQKSVDPTIPASLGGTAKRPICGIVRPIAAMDSYSESHWRDVHGILEDAITEAGFHPNLVSNSNEINIIHKTIVENLYINEMVVCDISGKNPNVMLELGMRLAFDKPTIVVKDDLTPFSFDTSPIEHITYPKDLRFGTIVEFKKKLTAKIVATHEKSNSDPNYSTFLKHFGEFTVVKIDQKEVSKEDYIIESLKVLTDEVSRLRKPKKDSWSDLIGTKIPDQLTQTSQSSILTIPTAEMDLKRRNILLNELRRHHMIEDAGFSGTDVTNSFKVIIQTRQNADVHQIFEFVHTLLQKLKENLIEE